MKKTALLILAASFLLTACKDQAEKDLDRLKGLEKEMNELSNTDEEYRATQIELIDGYRDYIADHPDDTIVPVLMFNMATEYITAYPDSLPSALMIYKKISEDYPSHRITKTALLNLANIYTEVLHHDDVAQEIYKQILNDFPGTHEAMQAEQLLKMRMKSPEEILMEVRPDLFEEGSPAADTITAE